MEWGEMGQVGCEVRAGQGMIKVGRLGYDIF